MTAPFERANLRLVDDPLSEAEVREGLALADLLAATFDVEPPAYDQAVCRANVRRLILARRG